MGQDGETHERSEDSLGLLNLATFGFVEVHGMSYRFLCEIGIHGVQVIYPRNRDTAGIQPGQWQASGDPADLIRGLI